MVSVEFKDILTMVHTYGAQQVMVDWVLVSVEFKDILTMVH